jgi:predicted TIM-barrel fold metal-dependent hydrolase
MSSHNHLSATEVRGRLRHPVIDADGHWIEFGPYIRDALRRIGGERAVEGYSFYPNLMERNLSLTPEQRTQLRVSQGPWWTQPTRNTKDRATGMMPALLHERMDEFGLDFSVLYPSAGNNIFRIADDETRRVTCRAFNTFTADYFDAYSDKMTPAAIIPMNTPGEAIAELDHAVRQLGFKVVCMTSLIPRPIVKDGAGSHSKDGTFPDLRAAAGGVWYDMLGMDSAYDYDPVWAKCLELGISPTFHTGSRGIGLRASPRNFVYNHIGHFAAAGEAVCKALFMGGVTKRFPTLKIGFLEGGVGWACQLLGDLIGHWEKRNLKALAEVDPKNIDKTLLVELARKYAQDSFAEALAEPEAEFDTVMTKKGSRMPSGNADLDDFAACGLEGPRDICTPFAENFYFGCEADDKMNAWAFNRRHNPKGARLNALFGSDIGHFDVADMAGVLPEAYELVEDELLSDDDFRDFMFANPVRFYAEANPNFFRGTRIEKDVTAFLNSNQRPA